MRLPALLLAAAVLCAALAAVAEASPGLRGSRLLMKRAAREQLRRDDDEDAEPDNPYVRCLVEEQLRFHTAHYDTDLRRIRTYIYNNGNGRGFERFCILVCVPANAVAACPVNGLRLLVHPTARAVDRYQLAVLGLEDRANNRIFPCFVDDIGQPWVHGNPWHFSQGIAHRHVRNNVGREVACEAMSLNLLLTTQQGLEQFFGSGPDDDDNAKRLNLMLGRRPPGITQISPVSLAADIIAVTGAIAAYDGVADAARNQFRLTAAQMVSFVRVLVASMEALRFDRVAHPVLQSLAGGGPEFAPTRQAFRGWASSLGREWAAIGAPQLIQQPPRVLSAAARQNNPWTTHNLRLTTADNYAADIRTIRDWVWNGGGGRAAADVRPWKVCVRNPADTQTLCLFVHSAYHPNGGVGFNPLYVIGAEINAAPMDRAFWFATSRFPGNLYPWENDATNRWNIMWTNEVPDNRIPVMKNGAVAGETVRFAGSYADMQADGDRAAVVPGNPGQFVGITPEPISAAQLDLDIAAVIAFLSQNPAPAGGFIPNQAQSRALARLVVVTMEAVRFDYIACNVRAALANAAAAFRPRHSSFKKWCWSLGSEANVAHAVWNRPAGPADVPAANACPAAPPACK